MRQFFPWARDFSEEELGRALLTLGLLPATLDRRRVLPATELLAEILLDTWQLRRWEARWPWRLHPAIRRLVAGPEEGRRLAEAARLFFEKAGSLRGLVIEVTPPPELDPSLLLKALRSVGAVAIEPSQKGADRGLSRGLETRERGLESVFPERGGESLGAQGDEAKHELGRTRASRPAARFLQTRVETAAGQTLGDAALEPQSDFRACVFIGARAAGWLGLGVRLTEPTPDPQGRPLSLLVVFWEPRLCPLPQHQELLLYPRGDTAVVRFPFCTAGPGFFEAGIAVYYRNRILQAGFLRGRVGDGPGELEFSLAAAPVPEFEGLEERREIGASFLLSRDAEGRPVPIIGHGGRISAGDSSDVLATIDFLESVREVGQAFRNGLEPSAWDPDAHVGLDGEGSRRLLIELAEHGSKLLRKVLKHAELAPGFETAGHIQIVQRAVDDFFPAEMLYSGPMPSREARICGGRPNAAAAIGEGRCCGALEEGGAAVLCPLRFWSFSKVIERHAHSRAHNRLGGRFLLRRGSAAGRLPLDPLAGAILAASARADRENDGTVERLRRKLAELVRDHRVAQAEDWEGWRKEVERSRPRLLVLLPHHQDDELEIGEESRSRSIGERDVGLAEEPQRRPVVLLIGCATAVATVPIENFAVEFHDAGAAIVVSTLASVLGRQAGPVAEVLVEEIHRARSRPDATFGEAMLAARRRLLAAGMPMVLGLTTYGDADWLIGQV